MPYTFSQSSAHYERAQQCIAGGINSGIRKMEQPVPLYFTHGKGSRLWDADGNEYIDFQTGQGAILFGHAPDGLTQALSEQASRGTHWAAQSTLEIEVAERLQQMVPSMELVRFSNSATEAVMAAFRLARSSTERPLILRFEGHYHGWGDEGLTGFGAPPSTWGDYENPYPWHPSQGHIREVSERFVIGQWNDPEQLRRQVDRFKGQIAAIIFEPVLCNTSCIAPSPEILATIRELCDRDSMLMIADETITGLRFGSGGAQGHYDFTPDLTIMGKALGGGTPFAVFGGSRSAMAKITEGAAIHAGTLNANPLCLAGSRWCLNEIQRLGTDHPASLNSLGQTLMQGLRDLAAKHDIPLVPQGPGLAFHCTVLKPEAETGPIRNYRDYVNRHDAPRWAHLRLMLLQEGVRAIERGLWFLSLAHSAEDITSALERADRAFARHRAEWSLPEA